MEDKLPLLEGVGLVQSIFEYLWTRNNLLQSKYAFHQCPTILIPDTILLRNKVAVAHYFSGKDGALQQRTRGLSLQSVTETLCAYDAVDVACVFVGKGPGRFVPHLAMQAYSLGRHFVDRISILGTVGLSRFRSLFSGQHTV